MVTVSHLTPCHRYTSGSAEFERLRSFVGSLTQGPLQASFVVELMVQQDARGETIGPPSKVDGTW